MNYREKYRTFISHLEQNLAGRSSGKTSSDRVPKNLRKNNPIYIWPAGRLGLLLYERFCQSGYVKVAIIDSNAQQLGNDYILLPGQVTDCANSLLIIASSTHSNNIFYSAKAMGFCDILMHYEIVDLLLPECREFPDEFFIDTFRGIKRHLLENSQKYIDMLNSLGDEISKMRFLDNMLFRLTGDITYTFPYDEAVPQYFNSIVLPPPSSNSVVVDGGGYTGDTLEQFLLYCKGEFKAYYLFEPDKNLISQAQKVSDDSRIYYIEKGLGKSPQAERYLSTGMPDGHFNDKGNTEVQITSVDFEIDEAITLIKLDIEGAELDALKGAEKTIRQCKPALAISLYHKASDYTDIFDFIRNCNPAYKFYIRHHWDSYADTVLYAIHSN